MRIERVFTNETCNQNCWFCDARRPAERPEFIARSAVRARIAAARAGGADAIARVPGAIAAALAAIRALAAAGVTVEVTTPIVRRNHALVAAVPGALARAELPIAALRLVIPTDAPDPSECAALDDVARAVTAVAESARRVGMALRLDTATYIPPCLLDVPE